MYALLDNNIIIMILGLLGLSSVFTILLIINYWKLPTKHAEVLIVNKLQTPAYCEPNYLTFYDMSTWTIKDECVSITRRAASCWLTVKLNNKECMFCVSKDCYEHTCAGHKIDVKYKEGRIFKTITVKSVSYQKKDGL